MTQNYLVRAIPLWVFGLLSTAAIVGAFALLIVPEIQDRKETPARIAGCHAQEGTARLDSRGVYVGCLVPARKAP